MASEKETKKFVSDDGVSTAATPEKPEGGDAKIDPKTQKNGEDGKIEKRTTPVKESVLELFKDSELSEEAKAEIARLFAEAVDARVEEKAIEMQESFDAELAEAKESLAQDIKESGKEIKEEVESRTEELLEGVSAYLDHVANMFMEENSIAIESSLVVEKAARIIDGLQNVMLEAKVEVTEESIDIFSELEEKLEEKEKEVNKLFENNIALKQEIEAYKRDSIVEEASRDLSESQAEQLREIAKKILAENHEEFKSDVLSLKDRMFKNPTKRGADINEENDVIQETVDTKTVKKTGNTEVDAIIAAINNLI